MFESNSSVLLILIALFPVVLFIAGCIKKKIDGLDYFGKAEKHELQAAELIKMTENDGAQRVSLLANCALMLTEKPPVTPISKRNIAFHVIARFIADRHAARGVPVPKLGREMNHAVIQTVFRILISEREAINEHEVTNDYSAAIYSDKNDEMSEAANEFIFKLRSDEARSAIAQASYNWIKEPLSSSPDARKQAF